ncbi:hypothetical protein H5410_034171 [Solanum commersonii]|uniref:Uncharacterized protein n=1 Tax=Solanum commersonii TaxID=4109 RepID=A0A9J5YQN1_SOLCO|nr:hypothetical protein H5410_034171 [Solanum commersonii]
MVFGNSIEPSSFGDGLLASPALLGMVFGNSGETSKYGGVLLESPGLVFGKSLELSMYGAGL